MSIIVNSRHEQMARYIADGKSATEAAALAGFVGIPYRISSSPEFRHLVADIVTSRLLDMLHHRDVVSAVEDDPHTWSQGLEDCIESYKTDGIKRDVKIISMITILEKLGQTVGLFKNGIELTGAAGGPIRTSLDDMTAEELAETYKMTMLGEDAQ